MRRFINLFYYRARALSEMKQSGIELAWLEKLKEEARALSEMKRSGIELAWQKYLDFFILIVYH